MVTTFTPAIQDFDVAVALGVIRNTNGNAYVGTRSYGLNPAVTASSTGLWERGTPLIFTKEPQFVRVKAGGSVKDIAGQSGVEDVIVTGLDDNFNIVSHKLLTAGDAQSLQTPVKFWRPFAAFCDKCGTYGGTNDGEIIIENEDGQEVLVIASGQSFSNYGSFSTPKDHVAVVRDVTVEVGMRNVDVTIFIRPRFDTSGAPFGVTQAFRTFREITPGTHDVLKRPFVIGEKTDVFVNAMSSSGGPSTVSVATDIILVPSK